MYKWCSLCKKPITKKEYSFSFNKFNKALCFEHQKSDNLVKEDKIVYSKKEPTKVAKYLGKLLKEKGWNVNFEKWDGHKHIDLAIEEAKMYLEVNGLHHNKNKDQALSDLKRTFYSFKEGYTTLMIPNCLVKKDSIYETAHNLDIFLKESVESLNKNKEKKGIFERLTGKKIEFV